MTGHRLKKGFALAILVLAVNMVFSQDSESIKNLYLQAKKKCHEREWRQAISQFEKLLQDYPGNKYEDDAKFWIGYCLEKVPGQRPQAFNAYTELIRKFPQSAWVDDAQVYQINLAEQFLMEGQESYRDFLYQKLGKEQKDIQFRAAIALGRAGDKKSIPVLYKMQGDEDYGDIARDLLTVLQIERMAVEDQVTTERQGDEIRLFYDAEQVNEAEDKSEILWFNTDRYNQYRSMLRSDDDWSEEELIDFALWHIIDTEEFQEYKSLDEYGKKEWQRKFWKRRDPTPTSQQNEFKDEFIRRIQYARANFSDFWNYLSFKYLPDQHLRLGWPHAPWDARGELYIKYGKPDTRSQHSWHTEEWTYYNYSVDFLVRQYMTNIYGNALHAGELSLKMYSHLGDKYGAYSHLNPFSSNVHMNFSNWNAVMSFLQANFIYKNEMRYQYDYNADPIDKIKIELNREASEKKGKMIFKYHLPVNELALIETSSGLEIRYQEVFCVLNEDLREVTRNELIRKIGNIPDEDYVLQQEILINVPYGNYTLYLRIEDQNAANLGIFSKEFSATEQ